MALTERSRGFTISGVLSERARTDPERAYLTFQGRTFTFGEIERDAEALAASLANLGIEPGNRVAVILPVCPEFVVTFFAVAKLGAVLVPLDPGLTPPELQYMLRHSEAVCAVTIETFAGEDFLQLFEGMFALLPELQYLVTVGEEDLWYDDRIFQFEDLVSAGEGRAFSVPAQDPDRDLYAVLYTSGTAGKPKGVELVHRNLVYAAALTADAVRLDSSDRVIGVTALFHVFGLGPGVLGSALAGANLLLQESSDPAETLALIERHRATVHYGVPTGFMAEIREQRRTPRDLSTLRAGVVAGAPMREELFREVQAELLPELLVAYSLTETASTFAIARLDDPPGKRHQTVGRPGPGAEVRVLEADGSELPVESLGEVAVRGPGVTRGYYRQPRETAASLDREGFLRTGDLGMVDEDGFLHLVGRGNEVIIRSGSNVYPQELEDRLHAHPAVQDVAVVGVQDPLLGEAICAAVVPVEGAIVNGEELRAWCRRTLAEPKVPDLVRFFDALPLTSTGRIRRVELSRLVEDGGGTPEL